MPLLFFSFGSFAQSPVHFTTTGSPHAFNGTSSFPSGIEDGFIVEPGAFVIICCRSGGATLKFNAGAKIEVQAGGTLKITSSVLEQNSLNPDDTWDGIVVEGNSGSEQYLTAPLIPTLGTSTNIEWEGVLISSVQGVLWLSASTIINAKIGVESIDGGILRIQDNNSSFNAVFLNCEVGVKINPYVSANCPNVNASYIMHSDFLWDYDNSNFTPSSLTGIDLNGVRGVNIGGCNFINSISSTFCADGRGTGIRSFNSDFSLAHSGNAFTYDEFGCLDNTFVSPSSSSSRGNVFQQLSNGIEISSSAVASGGHPSFNSIRYSNFTNTLNSIIASSTEALIVSNCNFNNLRSTGFDLLFAGSGCGNAYFPTNVIVDIYTTQAGGIRIINNEFTFDDKNVHHIHILHSDVNSNFKSFVKKNTFTNTYNSGGAVSSDEAIAVFLDESCENLNVTCNHFYNFGNDIFIGTNGEVSEFANDGGGNNFAPMNVLSTQIVNRFQLKNISTAMGTFPVYNWKIAVSDKPSSYPGFALKSNNNIADCSIACTVTAEELPEPAPCLISTNIKIVETNTLKIYPNPAHDILFINLQFSASDMDYPIQLINLEGKLIKEVLIKDLGSNNSIDLNGLKTGLYLIKVVTSNQSVSGRVLIQ